MLLPRLLRTLHGPIAIMIRATAVEGVRAGPGRRFRHTVWQFWPRATCLAADWPGTGQWHIACVVTHS